MKTLFLTFLLLGGCATKIPVPPLPSGHPARPASASASSPALQPYLTKHRAGVEKEETAAPMDHSKMEGM